MNQTTAGTLPTKRWSRLIPVAFITYSLAYLDRVNYGFGAIPEMFPRNVVAGAMSFVVCFGAFGSLMGAWIVGYLNGLTGSPAASYVFMGGALVLAVLLTMLSAFSSKYAPLTRDSNAY